MDGEPHERREDVIRRLKAGFANLPRSRVLSEELIAERREEATRETAEEERAIEAAEAQIDRGEGLSFREAFGEEL